MGELLCASRDRAHCRGAWSLVALRPRLYRPPWRRPHSLAETDLLGQRAMFGHDASLPIPLYRLPLPFLNPATDGGAAVWARGSGCAPPPCGRRVFTPRPGALQLCGRSAGVVEPRPTWAAAIARGRRPLADVTADGAQTLQRGRGILAPLFLLARGEVLSRVSSTTSSGALSGEFRVGERPAQGRPAPCLELLEHLFQPCLFPRPRRSGPRLGRGQRCRPPRRRSPHPWALSSTARHLRQPRKGARSSRALRSKAACPRASSSTCNSWHLEPCRHMHLLPDRADFFDQPPMTQPISREASAVDQCVAVTRPVGMHTMHRLAVRDLAPKLFGDEGHGGVQQDQALVDDPGHRRAGFPRSRPRRRRRKAAWANSRYQSQTLPPDKGI